MSWLSRQFSTRVLVLIPIAIAINIVLGYTVQTVLKLPIYLDSIGTILVGVLAGPIAGAATGAASNIIWQYAPGIGGGTIGPFAITAAVIGFLAGLWGYLGVYRPRPASGARLWAAVLIGALVLFLIVFLWQVPHFLAIAWIYREDYARAGSKMLPGVDDDGVRPNQYHWPDVAKVRFAWMLTQ